MLLPTSPSNRKNESGLTLLEVMISFTILAIMGSFVYSVVLGGSQRSRILKTNVELRRLAGAVLTLVTEDLRGAFVRQGVFPFFVGQDKFHGEEPADMVDLVTTTGLPVDPLSASGDLAEVGYSVSYEENAAGVLYRREESPPEMPDEEGGGSYVVCKGVRSFDLRFYDGEEWIEEWDSLDQDSENMKGRIPKEIEVEITLEDGMSSVTMRTRVAPPMAKDQS